MKPSQLYAKTKKAVEEFNLIKSGDKIAVGLSGGKDSLTLLYALSGLQKFKDANFQLHAIMVDLGFTPLFDKDKEKLENYCTSLNVELTVLNTKISEVIFNERNEKNPCSLCAKMRKGVLNKEAKRLGCNKVAYGHHGDDFIETFFLSLLYESRLHCMEPKFYMENQDLTLIRPLLYVNEDEIFDFSKVYNLPIVKNSCPIDGHTSRQKVKQLIKSMDKDFMHARNNFFIALRDKNFMLK